MDHVHPPVESVVEDPGEIRRNEILEAAAAVFGEKGFQRATMKDIAARAGIVPGTIYLYFKNKRDLLIAIADQLIYQPVGHAFSKGEEMTSEELLAALLKERLQFSRDNRDLIKALMPEIWTDSTLQALFFSQIIGPVLAGGAAFLGEKIAAGSLRECRMDIVVPAIAGSIIILSAVRSVAPEHLLSGISDEEIIAELTQLYLRGLLPDDAEPAE